MKAMLGRRQVTNSKVPKLGEKKHWMVVSIEKNIAIPVGQIKNR